MKICIDIECKDRDEAAETLRWIAMDVSNGRFSASCAKATQDEYRGTVFVTEDADA